MKKPLVFALLVVPTLMLLLLEGCQSPVRDSGAPSAVPLGPGDAASDRVRVEAGSVTSSTGCELEYLLYRPTTSVRSAQVVLAHGFLRSKERMSQVAWRLAEEGIPTVALDFCNTRVWDGAHEQNGADMIRVARQAGVRRVVYAGFSAGGLAAVIAASLDADAIGVLAMDLVDRDRLGLEAARGLNLPLIGLVGEPSSCNAQNNGLEVYAAAPHAQVIRVEGASHCDFEAPTDGLCRLLCEPDTRERSDALRARIIALAVDAISSLIANSNPKDAMVDALARAHGDSLTMAR